MQKKYFLVIALVFAFLATSAVAQIENKPELVLDLSVKKKVQVKGKDGISKIEWVNEPKTGPNDELLYTINYTNKGSSEAREAMIVDPIPSNTSYISGTAQGPNSAIKFSLDGKNFQTPTLLKYRIKQADGMEIERLAEPVMYTHIQWVLNQPIPPGGTGSVSFQVRVK